MDEYQLIIDEVRGPLIEGLDRIRKNIALWFPAPCPEPEVVTSHPRPPQPAVSTNTRPWFRT